MRALPVKPDSAFSAEEIQRFLIDARIPIRLACVDRQGYPLVASHWFQYEDGYLYCAIHRNSHIARLLTATPRCGFEVAADSVPYRGVRGQGDVMLSTQGGADRLNSLIVEYLGDTHSRLARWLLSRGADELLVRITPTWITSWDFTARMV